MDLEALLQSHGDDQPSGEDLEYDPAFAELEIAAQPGEERQAGDQILAAEEPDYKEIAEKALAVMERSHDLRAGIYLASANLRLRGLPGFADATSYIRRCLEDYWDTCHPQLDEDDDNDPTMRINSVLSLADRTTVLRGLRDAPLTDSRTFGRMSMRDISIAEGETVAPDGSESIPDTAAIAAAFQDTDDDRLKELSDAARSALDNVNAINSKFENETPGRGPELDPLIKLLKQISGRLGSAVGGEGGDDAGDGASEASEAPSAPVVAATGGGAVNNPNDVKNALDRIISYYERVEPSSPVPILLVRAKRLVGANFLTIVKDMAPDGVDNVNLVGGIEEEDID